MKFQLTEGTYDKLGVFFDYQVNKKSAKNIVTFTFAGEKEDECFVVLVNKKNHQVTRINVPNEYCLGSLRSVTVEHIDAKEYYYYYEINGKKVLDPYAKAIEGRNVWMDEGRAEMGYEIFNAFDSDDFDWSDDRQPEIPKERMIMYKLHVRGFSMGARSNKANGTFEAVKKKIDYFKRLNVTTLEFMPVYEFEEMDIPAKVDIPDYIKWEPEAEDVILPENNRKASDKVNYWGYGDGNYFAVKASYAMKPDNAAEEFKELVRTLHENQMECVMEMFFPDYINHNMVMDILHFWVRTYHVDGFHLLGNNLPMTAITQDMILSRTKMFYTYFEENAQLAEKKYKNLFVYKNEYQFPARKILNHINSDMQEFIDQQKKQGENLGYINYLASNNGFTLADTFMYNDRHNEANGENNMDGEAWNFSNNYGIEGPSKKKFVLAARQLRWVNAMTMLFLAQGVPMIWEGDEISNSANGNNNTYCQDNMTGWVDWKNEKKYQKNLEFLRKLTEFRVNHPILTNPSPYKFHDYASCGLPDVSYHGDNAWLLDINRDRMNVGVLYCGDYSKDEAKESVYIGYNFYSAVSTLALPKLGKKKNWYLVMDTSEDNAFLEKEIIVDKNTIEMKPLSICILIGK